MQGEPEIIWLGVIVLHRSAGSDISTAEKVTCNNSFHLLLAQNSFRKFTFNGCT
ncbi:unnamed protein product [Arabidopsis thaliana]|uniref:Uncharacterized protein n=1 Tax=Arabidopsis thaliana TaxID=3702 RepID=A0A5S9XH79_ARATH|nr:unnamed protein product [Arabidopsis thaliana]